MQIAAEGRGLKGKCDRLIFVFQCEDREAGEATHEIGKTCDFLWCDIGDLRLIQSMQKTPPTHVRTPLIPDRAGADAVPVVRVPGSVVKPFREIGDTLEVLGQVRLVA